MKRVLSLLFSVIIALSGIFTTTISALANSFSSAQPITLSQSIDTSVEGTVDKEVDYWVKFDCPASGYYDFSAKSILAPAGDVTITVLDAGRNVIDYAVNAYWTTTFNTTTYLTAGMSYYAKYEIAGAEYNFTAAVSNHIHSYTTNQFISAVGDDDADRRLDGGVRFVCNGCHEAYFTEYYYSPNSIAFSHKKVIYNKYAQTPAVSVYDRAGNVIPQSEYTVTYEDNIVPGKAYVTVDFIGGRYKGQMTSSFIIAPQAATAVSLKSTKSKQMQLKWKKDSKVTGYELKYSTSKKFYKSKTKTVTISKNSTTSKTITKLIPKKRYYVRIRSYKIIDGVKYYGSYSKVLNVKVKK